MSLEGALIRAPCCSVATVLLKSHVKKIVVTCDNLSHHGSWIVRHFVAVREELVGGSHPFFFKSDKSLWAGPTHKFKIREELVGGAHQTKKKK
jgi:hypothetical protein